MSMTHLNKKIEYYSTAEVAKLLNISRVAVFYKIKAGQIRAEKVGRSYVIQKSAMDKFLSTDLTDERKQDIEVAVKKTVHDYGETLELLGKDEDRPRK